MYFDWILRGGWVIDGSGALPYRADVAITDTVIGDIGRLDEARAAHEVDVTGHYVVPGFIDTHVHGDLMMLADTERVAQACLRQGITTLINGQDGSAFAPASPPVMDHMRRYTVGFNGNPPNLKYDWSGYVDYFRKFHHTTPLNMAYLIPNGNVRMEVMGLTDRKPTSDEVKAMRPWVRGWKPAPWGCRRAWIIFRAYTPTPRKCPNCARKFATAAGFTSRTCAVTGPVPKSACASCSKFAAWLIALATCRTITALPNSSCG
jgi:hypothetical protein